MAGPPKRPIVDAKKDKFTWDSEIHSSAIHKPRSRPLFRLKRIRLLEAVLFSESLRNPPIGALSLLTYLYCTFESHLPNTSKPFGMNGGDDGARNRELCRDRVQETSNLLKTRAMDKTNITMRNPWKTLLHP